MALWRILTSDYVEFSINGKIERVFLTAHTNWGPKNNDKLVARTRKSWTEHPNSRFTAMHREFEPKSKLFHNYDIRTGSTLTAWPHGQPMIQAGIVTVKDGVASACLYGATMKVATSIEFNEVTDRIHDLHTLLGAGTLQCQAINGRGISCVYFHFRLIEHTAFLPMFFEKATMWTPGIKTPEQAP